MVFEISPPASGSPSDTPWIETVLHSFGGNPDGAYPIAGLLQDAQGNLYGTTYGGGVSDDAGMVFELSPNGSGGWIETVLYTFCYQGGCTDGADPYAGLVQDAQGNLYGTTYVGGAQNYGTVFELQYGWLTQTITVTVPAPAFVLRNSSFTVAATASSGLPVLFSSSGVCTNSGATFMTGSKIGTCTVMMSQAGNGTYATAPKVIETTTVVKTPIAPTVTFTGAPGSAEYLATFPVVATSNSGATPTITATGACTISGTTVTMSSGSGKCTMTAAWAASFGYKAASLKQYTTAEPLTGDIAWATPAAITYGTPLSATQLDATANVAGSFSYSPKAGTILAAGTQTLSVTFKPTLRKYYAGSDTSVELTVNAADTTTTISKATAPKATPLVVTVTFAVASQNVGSKAQPTGSVTVTDGVSATTCTGTLASGKGSCVLTFPSAEMSPPASLTATYSPDNANDNASASTPAFAVTVQ
jgi:uncharacterized repeat protein (TIGR03803 family)